jgi:hypothetical protein
MLDFLDDFVWGRLNFIECLLGMLNQGIKPSKGGRFGPLVKITMKRVDKGGQHGGRAVAAHLRCYGVPTFYHGYDSRLQWLYVRETQAKYAAWLFDGARMRTPKKKWGQRAQ